MRLQLQVLLLILGREKMSGVEFQGFSGKKSLQPRQAISNKKPGKMHSSGHLNFSLTMSRMPEYSRSVTIRMYHNILEVQRIRIAYTNMRKLCSAVWRLLGEIVYSNLVQPRLLSALTGKQPNRPLILIAHSLGGIIVKDASLGGPFFPFKRIDPAEWYTGTSSVERGRIYHPVQAHLYFNISCDISWHASPRRQCG